MYTNGGGGGARLGVADRGLPLLMGEPLCLAAAAKTAASSERTPPY